MFVKDGEVSLRDFTENDIGNKVRWINDPSNNKYLHYDIPLEAEKTLEWFRNKDNQCRADLIIEYDGTPVGLIGLLNIDRVNKKAEYYICLGEHSYKRKGISKKSSKLILNYAFNDLGLNKVYLNVDSENMAACNLYTKIGFVCEGEFKRDLIHRGEYIDRKRFAIFKENF